MNYYNHNHDHNVFLGNTPIGYIMPPVLTLSFVIKLIKLKISLAYYKCQALNLAILA